MKKMLWVLVMITGMARVRAQGSDIEQLKLDIEKLVQMKMMLHSMYDGYKTITNGYNQVTGIARGNYELHEQFLNGLLQVSLPVKNYPHVQTVKENQDALVRESSAAYASFLKSGLFKAEELLQIKTQFDQLKNAVARQVDQLNMVLTPGILRMSDQERMSAIDRIDKDVGEAVGTMRKIVKGQAAIAAQRGQQKRERESLKALYGLQ